MTSVTLFVGDLSYFCNESNLIDLFSCYGHVERAIIRRSREGMTLNYGFVTITKDSALSPTLIEDLEGKLFLGRHLRVNIQNQNTAKPQLSPRKIPVSYQVYVRFQSDAVNVRVDETILLSIFSVYGPIVDCIVKEHTFVPETHRTCGYAFLYYQEKEGAARAVAATSRAEDNQPINNTGSTLPTGMVVNCVLYKCSFPKVLTQAATNTHEAGNITSDNQEGNNTSTRHVLERDDSGSSMTAPVPCNDEPNKSIDSVHVSPRLQPSTDDKVDKQIKQEELSTNKSVVLDTSLKNSSSSVYTHSKKPQPLSIDHNKNKASPHPSPKMMQYPLLPNPTSIGTPKGQVLPSYPMLVTQQTTMSPHTQQHQLPTHHQQQQHSPHSSMVVMMPPSEAYPTNMHTPHNINANNSFVHMAAGQVHHHHQLYLVPVTPSTTFHPSQQTTGNMTITSKGEFVPSGMVPVINQVTHPTAQQPMYFYPTPITASSAVYSSAPTDRNSLVSNPSPHPTLLYAPHPGTAQSNASFPPQQHSPVEYQDVHKHQLKGNVPTSNYNPSFAPPNMVMYPTQQAMSLQPITQAYIPSQITQYPPQQAYNSNANSVMDMQYNQVSMYGYPPASHVMYPTQQGMHTMSVAQPLCHHPAYNSYNNNAHSMGNVEKNITHHPTANNAGTM